MSEILSIGELLDLGGSASTAGLIPYSALEYSAQVITGISGTAIGGQGGTDSATVSAIASAYAESAASGKLDNSASGLWYPLEGNPSGFLTGVDLTPYAYASSVSSKVDQSAFDECCSSMSSVVSSLETSVTSMSSVVSGLTGDYLEKSASSMFQPSGDYQTAGDYAFNSSVSSKLDASASSMFQPSGDYQTAGDYAYNSSLSSKLDASASSQFAPSGDYADKSALSSYVPVSASGQFAPSGDYAFNSALSGKLDASASSQFAPSGDYTYNSSLSAYQDRSSISAWTGDLSSISGKLDQSAFTAYSSTVNNNITSIENNITAISSVVSGKADASAVHTYTGVSPVVVDNVNDQISLSATAVHLDSSMTAYTSGGSGFIGVNADFNGFVHPADMSAYIPTSQSSKFQLTANMSAYYQTSNPSSFATTAYVNSSVSGKLDASSEVVTATGTASSIYSGSYFTGIDEINGLPLLAKSADIAESAWNAHIAASARAFNSAGTAVTFSAVYDEIIDMRSSKLDTTAQTVTSLGMKSSYVSGINGSSLYAQSAYQSNKSEYASYADSAWISDHEQVPMSAFAYASAVSSKLDASASSDFYSTSNPSGFLTSSYSPTFGYDDDKISSIDGSALAGGGGGMSYTSPSGTLAVDNVNGTIDAWNSSMRVDEHVTAASSFPGTAQQVYSSTYGYSAIWSGTAIPGDIVNVSAYCYLDNLSNYSASAFGVKAGGGTSKLSEFYCEREGYGPYTASGSASVTLDDTYSSIYMLVSGQYYVPSTGQYSDSISGIANVERPGATASSTSVYEQVLKDSDWATNTANWNSAYSLISGVTALLDAI